MSCRIWRGNRPGVALPVPPEIRLEVEIAAGERIGSRSLAHIAEPAALTCPACGGVLSTLEMGQPLRFRCQVGHAYTAEALAREQEGQVDEAMRVALRIIELREDALPPRSFSSRRSRAGVGKVGPAEKSRQFVGHFDYARREHGSTLAFGRGRGNRAPDDLPAVAH